MAKTKILFIITYLELGGAQTQLLSILKGLDRSKYEISLYAGASGHLQDAFMRLSGVRTVLDPCLVRTINPFFDIASFLRLFYFIKKNGFDIVHTHSPKASLLGSWAAALAGVKHIIYTVHGWPFHDFMNPLVYRTLRFIERVSAKITTQIITVSRADLKKGIVERVAPVSKLILIHYGIDMERFERIYAERKKREYRDHLILNVSSLKRQKGLEAFLEAVKQLRIKHRSFEVSLVGEGPLRKRIEEVVEKAGLTSCLRLHGWVDDMDQFFLRASVLVLTSLWEGLPLVAIEAACAGIPVVVTNTGGISDVLEDGGGGRVVSPACIEEIVCALEDIVDNYSQWQEKALVHAERIDRQYWSTQRMIDQLETIYDAV